MDLSTPALLFPAIAILMLGFINRYLGAAGVIRNFKKDYDSGYKHTNIVGQMTVMRKRITIIRYMLGIGTVALLLACVSMLVIFLNREDAGYLAFGGSMFFMVLSLLFSLYEITLSNDSLNIEINDVMQKEATKK